MATPRKTNLPIPVWQKIHCAHCLQPKGMRCKSNTGRITSAPHSTRYKDLRKRQKRESTL